MNKTGFGFLRLPRLTSGEIDYAVLEPMVDAFLSAGGTYFDTAYTYLGGLSEEAIRKALVQRHPRERFVLADKLPGYKLRAYEEGLTYFEEQLRRCGVEYFDVYLLHWLNEKHYAIAQALDEFRFLRELKAAGKVRKIGFSYHDSPELLEQILTEHPEVDIVQLQINYLDWDSVSLQAEKLYEVACGHGKEVVVMEPVKGGALASIPADGECLLKQMHPEESVASWAIRFVTSLPQVSVVLSGMNTMEQLRDNMRDFAPVSLQEREALSACARIIRSATAIACTGCGYCLQGCPQSIPIPHIFALYNDYARNPKEVWKMRPAYRVLTRTSGEASACVGCRSCEESCPQKLPITELLADSAKAFEN